MKEAYISVDVETSGPVPGEFSMLTIGACVVGSAERGFYAKLKPLNNNAVPEAMKVTGLSLEELRRDGQTSVEAMKSFAAWLKEQCGEARKPVFVGLNAPFDWSFVNYYFHRFTGDNPFGFTAIDIKALYMGATGCTWDQTSSTQIAKRVLPVLKPTHNALDDALYQAELFDLVRSLTRTSNS